MLHGELEKKGLSKYESICNERVLFHFTQVCFLYSYKFIRFLW